MIIIDFFKVYLCSNILVVNRSKVSNLMPTYDKDQVDEVLIKKIVINYI